MEFKPGIYFGKPRSEYDSIGETMNISTLLHGLQSMMHLKHFMDNPQWESTEAMTLGIAAHIAVYESPTFSDRVVASRKFDMRKTVDKEERAEFEKLHAGKIILNQESFDTVVSIRDSVARHPLAKEILDAKGHGEVVCMWEVETEFGTVRCKGLLDRLNPWRGWPLVSDLKTCDDASPKSFQRAVANYHYGIKAAFYLDALDAIAPLKSGKRRFFWIAVEKVAPFAVAVYEPDEECLDNGRKVYRRLLNEYAEARKTGVWRGYPIGIEPIKLAPWQKEKELA